ncbi:PAS domain S-box protein [Baekduia sp. Peel2402]|uniref:PAS domain S-box protein n=1 Tax=Baekduia sp. Peel2402 TaxID=3458296 RepID=UPI00403E4BEF
MSVAQQSAGAYERLLRTITERLDWRLAAAWEPATAEGGALACVACSSTDGPGDLAPFLDATRTTILRLGEGLPGRVFAAGTAEWLTDATVDDRLPRRDAATAAGLHAAVAFPVRSERGTVGVVELFADRPRDPDPELLATLDLLGAMLGQLVERRLADARHRATLQAALDCVVTMDAQGKVVEFNAAAERTFGYNSTQAVGHDMADLIVPPELREPHRRGLHRYLETDTPHLLDRRIEIEAQRADGERFPVELTITRIDVGGDTLFTGHLRDISDRKRSEAELRDSRARIVHTADAARRQIERDLHDGAQQSLVSLAVTLRLAQRRLDNGDADAARELLTELDEGLTEALAELRELARGIHPAILTEGGLAPALNGLVRRSALAARVAAPPADGRRYGADVEAAAYFLVAEGLTNAARHAASATVVEIAVVEEPGVLVVEVRDDGAGGADPDGGGLRGLADRLAVLGGVLTVTSPPSGGTVLRGEIPCAS